MPPTQRLTSRLRFAEYRAKRRAKAEENKKDPAKEKAEERTLGRLLRELWGVLEGHRLPIAVSLGLLSFGTLLKLLPPAATKIVIDHVLIGKTGRPASLPAWIPFPEDPRVRLLSLVVVVFIVALIGVAVSLASRWIATATSKRVQMKVRRRVFEHAARLPLHRVYALKSGGSASLLREDAGGVGELIFSMLFYPWRAIVQFLGGFFVLAWVDWRLLIGAVVLLPFAYATSRLWEKRIRPLFRDIRSLRQDLDARTTEAFGGMRVVRAFGRQRRETSRFVGENHLMARQELHVWWLSRGIEVIWDLFLPAASGLLLLYGGLHVLEGKLSLGDLMMFLVYLAMLLEPLAVIATSVTQFQSNLGGLRPGARRAQGASRDGGRSRLDHLTQGGRPGERHRSVA